MLNLAENLVLVVIFEPVVLLVILEQNLVLEEPVDLKLVLNIVLVVLDLVSKKLTTTTTTFTTGELGGAGGMALKVVIMKIQSDIDFCYSSCRIKC